MNLIRLILRLDYEQDGLRNMRNTQEQPPVFLCGSLKAKLLYQEQWEPPEEIDEGEGDQPETEEFEEEKDANPAAN